MPRRNHPKRPYTTPAGWRGFLTNILHIQSKEDKQINLINNAVDVEMQEGKYDGLSKSDALFNTKEFTDAAFK